MRGEIAIVTETPGWHGRRLRRAFAARGYASRYLSLRDCALHVDAPAPRVELAGFDAPPAALFVRGVPGGTLEEVVYWLDLLHALKACGVPVYNDGRAIERTVDKSLTSFLLARDGLPTPPTWIISDRQRAAALVAAEHARGHAVLCKPLFGAQGVGLRLLERGDALPEAEAVKGVWYLQRFIRSEARGASDWRLFVIGGRAVAAMRRTSDGWLTNVAQGGSCHPALPEGEPARLAERAVAGLELAYGGVDLLRDRDGRWWLLEVNSIPAWRGLQGVSPVDIAGLLADDLIARLGATRLELAR